RRDVDSSTQPMQFSVLMPRGELGSISYISVSPDGRWLTFETSSTLWVRPVDSGEARQLKGSADGPIFWSPDSKQVAFFADQKLQATEIATGVTRTLADMHNACDGGGDWGRDGVILFGCATGIYQVASGGGTPSRLDLKDGAESRLMP